MLKVYHPYLLEDPELFTIFRFPLPSGQHMAITSQTSAWCPELVYLPFGLVSIPITVRSSLPK